MNSLQEAAKVYSRICAHNYRFSFDNGEHIVVKFTPQNFGHLAGLGKFADLREFQKENGKPVFSGTSIYKMALRGKFDDYYLQTSAFYNSEARDRIEYLSRLDQLLHTEKAVFNFDKAKLRIVTRLKSSVILFSDEGFHFYLMLGLAENGRTYYPETFFLRFDDAYFVRQEIVKITKIEAI